MDLSSREIGLQPEGSGRLFEFDSWSQVRASARSISSQLAVDAGTYLLDVLTVGSSSADVQDLEFLNSCEARSVAQELSCQDSRKIDLLAGALQGRAEFDIQEKLFQAALQSDGDTGLAPFIALRVSAERGVLDPNLIKRMCTLLIAERALCSVNDTPEWQSKMKVQLCYTLNAVTSYDFEHLFYDIALDPNQPDMLRQAALISLARTCDDGSDLHPEQKPLTPKNVTLCEAILAEQQTSPVLKCLATILLGSNNLCAIDYLEQCNRRNDLTDSGFVLPYFTTSRDVRVAFYIQGHVTNLNIPLETRAELVLSVFKSGSAQVKDAVKTVCNFNESHVLKAWIEFVSDHDDPNSIQLSELPSLLEKATLLHGESFDSLGVGIEDEVELASLNKLGGTSTFDFDSTQTLVGRGFRGDLEEGIREAVLIDALITLGSGSEYSSEQECIGAIELIQKSGDERASQAIIKALRDPSPQVRGHAILAINVRMNVISQYDHAPIQTYEELNSAIQAIIDFDMARKSEEYDDYEVHSEAYRLLVSYLRTTSNENSRN